MVSTRVKCLASLTGLALIGIGPIPFTELLGYYIITKRPHWFRDTVNNYYIEGAARCGGAATPLSETSPSLGDFVHPSTMLQRADGVGRIGCVAGAGHGYPVVLRLHHPATLV